MTAEQINKINALQQIFSDSFGLSCWAYDNEMDLKATTCPQPELFTELFRLSGGRQYIYDFIRKQVQPINLEDRLSLHWLAVPVISGAGFSGIYVLGPCLGSYTSEQSIYEGFKSLRSAHTISDSALEELRSLPVILHHTLMSFGVMLYQCVNGEKTDAADIHIRTLGNGELVSKIHEKQVLSPKGLYVFEKRYFSAITEGNTDYKAPLFYDPNELGRLGPTPLRNAKNQTIIKITLSTRAAIDGQVPEVVAFAISDRFIQMVEDSSNIADVYNYGSLCYQEFVKRVRRIKELSDDGRIAQKCKAYIETHLTEKIDYSEMASSLGYNRQYLSCKFKKETGMTLGEFIMKQRLEYAKLLLRNSNYSILEISQLLQFSTCSYFSSSFRNLTGMTPREYRNLGSLPAEETMGFKFEKYDWDSGN